MSPVRLTPEVVLISDTIMSKVRWTLDRETERLDALVADPGAGEVRTLLKSNGWTTRMLAWQHIISGLMDLARFDDEDGRA